MNNIYIVGTLDTKGDEINYARERIESAGARAVVVDVSTRPHALPADFDAGTVAGFHPDGAAAVLGLEDRGSAVGAMATALAGFLRSRTDIAAVLGLGGTGNTALVTQGMRALPIGTPKLMVSTVASGNTAPYVGPNDICMMYSVVDIAGLNAISRRVIGNAAHAVAGMALNTVTLPEDTRPSIAMTMFGVTTECVNQVRRQLEDIHDVYVFHATGVGGQSMEKLVDSGLVEGVIDATTTEVADLLVGGVFAATEDRFGAFIRTKRSYVGSVGAVDMVNFGARESVPERFSHRRLHVHNPQVTLMRTTPEENEAIGRFIVERLNRCEGSVRFLLPLRGVSALDAQGQPFHDPEADGVLFETIRAGWKPGPDRKLIEIDAHINDPGFATALAENYLAIGRQP